ncbi:MAG: polysaccharide biosynthesis tyrosine autokinase [Terracidiphilus sp.]
MSSVEQKIRDRPIQGVKVDQGRTNSSGTNANAGASQSFGLGGWKNSAKDLSLIELRHVVLKHRMLVFGSILGAVLLAIIITILMPHQYDAVAQLELEPQNSNGLGVSGLDLLTGSDLDEEARQETQVHVLKTDTIAWGVIKSLRLDTRKEFAGPKPSKPDDSLENIDRVRQAALIAAYASRLKVLSIPKTRIIEVRFRSLDPQLAADVANTVTRMYLQNSLQTRFQSTEEASSWLTKQLQGLKEQVQSSQHELEEYQKQAGILISDEGMGGAKGSNGASTHNVMIARLDELNKQWADAEGQRMLAEAKYQIGKSGDPELILQVEPSSALAALRAQRVDLDNQYAQLTAKFGDKYPRVIQVRNQLDQTNKSIATEVDNTRSKLKAQYESALKSEQMLSAEYDKQKQEAYRLNESSIRYLILKQDFDANQGLYQDLVQKLREAGILAGLKSTNATVIEPASAPVSPSSPIPLLNVAIGMLIGTFVGLSSAFLRENLDTSIPTPEDAESLSGYSLMGVIPHVTEKDRKSRKESALTDEQPITPMVALRPQSVFAEAFRLLRTSLMLSSPGSPPKVIMVTSGVPGEGKTLTSLNLAVVLAQKHKRVLLLDADLRLSGISHLLGMEVQTGFSSCLAGGSDPADAIVTFPNIPNVDVLLAGTRPPDPADLLDSERMRTLMAAWRNEYDHIVIDTPPLLGLSDAGVISSMTDVVLLVVRSSKTGRQTLIRARDALSRANCRRVGIIFNDLATHSADHYAYYGYYGSKYSDYYGDLEEKK